MKRKRTSKKRMARGLSPLEAVTKRELLRSIRGDLRTQARAAGLALPEPSEKHRKK